MNHTYLTLLIIAGLVSAFLLGRLYQVHQFRKRIPYYLTGMDMANGEDETSIAQIDLRTGEVEYFVYDPLQHADWERKQEEEKRYALKNLELDEDEL